MFTEKEQLQIKKKLLEKGVTQTELAKTLGIPRTRLSGIINGSQTSPIQEKKILDWFKDRW